jgi:hypothetical protein
VVLRVGSVFVDRYVYLLSSIVLCLCSGAMLVLRRDLVRVALTYGLVGSIVQALTETEYTRDYWAPPTVLRTSISVEDFLFGFGVTTLPLLSYPVLCRRGYGRRERRGRLGVYLSFAVVSAVALFAGPAAFSYNSIVVSCVLLGTFTLVICVLRPDLGRPALYAVCVTTAAAVICYIVLFDLAAPDWWARYWKLSTRRLGVTVLGNVPVTELACYVTWAGFAVTQHPFITGRTFEPLPRAAATATADPSSLATRRAGTGRSFRPGARPAGRTPPSTASSAVPARFEQD